MVDAQISTRLEDSIKKSFRSYTTKFEKKAKYERKRYIDLVKKPMKEIIKDEVDKDLFDSYGKAYSLKRAHEDKNKDEDPPAGSDQGLKKRKTSKDAKPSRGSKSSRGTSEASKNDWFKKPERPPTPDLDWNAGKQIDFRPPQTCISKIANARKPHFTFDELIITPINFSAYVLNNLKIENLTQEYLVRPAFNLLKGQCEKPEWNSKYYLEECGSLSIKYTTSTTKTKAAKYDIIEGIEDMVPSLWSPVKMFTKHVVILKRVKDLQLGVESYQKKLNITRSKTFMSDITKMTPYTTYNNPQGIIYQDKFQRNRLMHFDELYKFFDGTLSSVRRVFHDIASSLEMDYFPKRRLSKLDRKRSCIMIKAIDQQLFERMFMRNLEKFVRGREYRNDFRLLGRTI
ncbi:hypothetical protein Tco_1516054 [Tanacetum coccineum]